MIRVKASRTHDISNGGRQMSAKCPFRMRTVRIRIENSSQSRKQKIDIDYFVPGISASGRLIGESSLTADDLAAEAKALNEVWSDSLISLDVAREEDLTRHRNVLNPVWQRLAVAGHRLFVTFFSEGDPTLRFIGEMLAKQLRDARHVITVDSTSVFFPWPMLYVPRLGCEVDGKDLDGFWGFRHLVEHNLDRELGLELELDEKWTQHIRVQAHSRTSIGAFIDRNLDDEADEPEVVKPVLEVLYEAASLHPREYKSELKECLETKPFPHQVMYLCCHGGPEGSFCLTDTEPIEIRDVAYWLNNRGKPLETNPVLFANMCQGGNVSSSFYNGMTRKFLNHGGNCVIGPQVDIPYAFAKSYAIKFFHRFLKRHESIGEITHALAMEYARKRNNPLGLTYSLYRGVDTHLCERPS